MPSLSFLNSLRNAHLSFNRPHELTWSRLWSARTQARDFIFKQQMNASFQTPVRFIGSINMEAIRGDEWKQTVRKDSNQFQGGRLVIRPHYTLMWGLPCTCAASPRCVCACGPPACTGPWRASVRANTRPSDTQIPSSLRGCGRCWCAVERIGTGQSITYFFPISIDPFDQCFNPKQFVLSLYKSLRTPTGRLQTFGVPSYLDWESNTLTPSLFYICPGVIGQHVGNCVTK